MILFKKIFTLVELIFVLVVLPLIIGWVLNVYSLIKCEFDPIGTEEIFRVIGIFVAPLGGFLGYMNF
jgi:hypothetical protein